MTSQQTLSSKVALTFSCKGLKNKDVTSKSDPIIQVLMKDSRRQTWKEVRKTCLPSNTWWLNTLNT